MTGGPDRPGPAALLAAATGNERTARDLAAAGADTVVAYHSSAYRERGIPSVAGLLPWASANQQTLDMLPAVLRGAGRTPVVATVCANDALHPPARMLAEVARAGARGVLNAPTVGLFTGPVAAALEEHGLGRSAEIALIGAAHAAGLTAWSYAFDAEWTAAAVGAGADVVVIHLGLTGGPGTGDLAGRARACLDAVPREVPVLLHGGPLRAPADLTALLAKAGGPPRPVGFFGASAFENPPDGTDAATAMSRWRRALTPSP